MNYLKVKTNRRLEIDPLAGIVFPIEKDTLLGMSLSDLKLIHEDKITLKLLPAGKALLLPFTHFNIPHRGKGYSIFMTERNSTGLHLYAAFELKDRLHLLTQIQNRDAETAKTRILKVSISTGKVFRKLVSLREIEPLF
jgi:hypothetical protein